MDPNFADTIESNPFRFEFIDFLSFDIVSKFEIRISDLV